jgi:hypothetical protein
VERIKDWSANFFFQNVYEIVDCCQPLSLPTVLRRATTEPAKSQPRQICHLSFTSPTPSTPPRRHAAPAPVHGVAASSLRPATIAFHPISLNSTLLRRSTPHSHPKPVTAYAPSTLDPPHNPPTARSLTISLHRLRTTTNPSCVFHPPPAPPNAPPPVPANPRQRPASQFSIPSARAVLTCRCVVSAGSIVRRRSHHHLTA